MIILYAFANTYDYILYYTCVCYYIFFFILHFGNKIAHHNVLRELYIFHGCPGDSTRLGHILFF